MNPATDSATEAPDVTPDVAKQQSEFVQDMLSRRNIPQRTPRWYETRGRMLTASDVAAAIGVNKYTSRAQLLKRKTEGSSFSGNAATAWGQKYEDVAIAEYERRTGEVVHDCGLFVHEGLAWLGGSPDGLTNSGKLIEVKCPYKRPLENFVPAHYMPQVQTCLEICNVEQCDFIQVL